MKLESFCTAEEMISRMTKQPTELEKFFLNYISNRGLISRIYKGL